MNYELAKKLKDAGFNFRYITEDESMPFPEDLTWFWHTPTLTELIEACGDAFYSLTKEQVWVARAYDRKDDEYVGTGQTPEEAVANLWLTLNKKD